MKDPLMTINSLADALGHDRRTLKRILKNVPPAQQSGSRKLYRLSDVQRAIGEAQKQKATAKQKLEVKILAEKLRALKRENAIAEGKLISLEKARTDVFQIARAQRNFLQQRLERELPARLVGLDFFGIQKILEDTTDQICSFMNKITFTDAHENER